MNISIENIEFQFGSYSPNTDGLYDLYLIHRKKVEAGILSLHPHRWVPKDALSWLLMQTDLLNDKEPCYIIVGGKTVDHRNKLSSLNLLHRNRKRSNYYFSTKNIAIKYGQYPLNLINVELAIQDRMWEENTNLQLEVLTNVGRIDCLTDRELIEIKRASSWKHGLGQLMAYSQEYRNHKKILHLFDNRNRDNLLSKIVPVCQTLEVEVRFERIG